MKSTIDGQHKAGEWSLGVCENVDQGNEYDADSSYSNVLTHRFNPFW